MIEAFAKKVIVTDLEHGVTVTDGGIVLGDDDGTLRGIHARWAKVHSVGEEVNDVKVGEWILIDHGRWSYHFVDGESETQYWLADYPDGILAVADHKPKTFAIGKEV